MPDVIWDNLVNNPRFNRTLAGWEVERTALVTGLSGYPNRVNQVNDALLETGVNIGSSLALPALSNCFCEEIHPSFPGDSQDIVELTFVFRQRWPELSLEIDTALVQEETCYDKDHNLMRVTYTPTGSSVEKDDKILAPKMVQCVRWTLTRMEQDLPAGIIGAKSVFYTGKVNAGSWQMEIGAPSRVWLINRIAATSNDRLNFRVTYELLRKFDGWIYRGFYLDPKTGRLPKDIPTDTEPGQTVNGSIPIQEFDLYDEVDISDLDLDYP